MIHSFNRPQLSILDRKPRKQQQYSVVYADDCRRHSTFRHHPYRWKHKLGYKHHRDNTYDLINFFVLRMLTIRPFLWYACMTWIVIALDSCHAFRTSTTASVAKLNVHDCYRTKSQSFPFDTIRSSLIHRVTRTCFYHISLQQTPQTQSDITTLITPTDEYINRPVDSTSETMLLPVGEDNKVQVVIPTTSIWERLAFYCISIQHNLNTPNNTNTDENRQIYLSTIATPDQLYDYAQYISVLRVIIPSIGYATIAKLIYPSIAMHIASLLQGELGIFAVVSQDASQYLQNICTTSGLVFSILIGQTYYFMYQQQEKIYYALYDEVAMAKMVLEQITLISRGRTQLYHTMLLQMNRYVQDDLQHFSDTEPALLLSGRPCDDPLEDILYLTSVGEPSQIYQSLRSLRQARAYRLGSLQLKLPEIQMTLLWILAAIVLCVFPLLGAGSQTIGGYAILQVQSWYISFLVFGISLVMGIIYELRSPNQPGAYNARTVLSIMISGLQEELQHRLQYAPSVPPTSFYNNHHDISNELEFNETTTNVVAFMDDSPSIDNDGSF
jgi:hypothetical protein